MFVVSSLANFSYKYITMFKVIIYYVAQNETPEVKSFYKIIKHLCRGGSRGGSLGSDEPPLLPRLLLSSSISLEFLRLDRTPLPH